MSSKTKSRWANDEEDEALEVQRKKEKEEKKRLKAEKQRKAEEAAAAQIAAQQSQAANTEHELSSRPAKRRKLTPPPPESAVELPPAKLLRFPAPAWKKCRSVEDYEKLNDIEEGAYGWVSRARDTTTGKIVALKRLKMDNVHDGVPVTGLREVQTLMDCDHPNIVGLREVVVGEDTSKIENIFLVLDFLEHDLKSLLEDMPEPFLTSETKTLLHQLTSGVLYLHTNWIMHRDLKTSNLLLNNRGGKNEVDELSKIFELCGIPTETTWPSFRRLPNARSLRLPQNPIAQGSVLRSKFPFLTNAGSNLLTSLLSLNPAHRPSAQEVLDHPFFKEDPRMKDREMFPTFPSKAGLEKRRRKGTPNAPGRGKVGGFNEVDFSGIFGGDREVEERGGGFALKLI
ncbi:putative Cyclin-dependent kinase G-2 [Glarea lozoyensis 74030]|uniref:cyclin-dependent kinase n=1 Tax=Glarea lozoyensis (strain ATCC 74030 / MF5533) TaxID=1104152 RepID=H0ESW3_GLAL7|nr:putative Cyclin-dependent kinase G-2 [Glarea lozoyensis 74030]